MGVDVTVSTTRNEFFAGEVVEGLVSVNVDTNDFNGSSASNLVLQLVGQAVTQVMATVTTPILVGDVPTMYTQRNIITEKQEFLTFDVTLTSFGGRVDRGTHSFPFAVVLPPNLPSSMKEDGKSGDSCAIAYGFKARLHRPGLLHFDATGKAQIKVVARPQEIVPTPVLVGPDTQIVRQCCCFKRGSMSIGFQADRSVVGRNERLGLTVLARNDSSSSVKEMRIEIWQDTTWYARGHKASCARVIGSFVVPGSQLGAIGRGAELGSDRGRTLTAVADAAQRSLREVLASGAGLRQEIMVPDKCTDTMNTGIITVRHSLAVLLKTHGCSSTPQVSTALIIQSLPRGATFAGGGDTGCSSFAGEAPYAKAVPVGTDGHPTPIHVPQEAVAIEVALPCEPFAPIYK